MPTLHSQSTTKLILTRIFVFSGHVASVITSPFEVYSPRNFPGALGRDYDEVIASC
jgi:hypothetical protein